MTNQISHVTNPSVTLSMMISEAVYRVVVHTERVFRTTPGEIAPREVVRHSFTHFDLDIYPLQIEIDPRAVADADDALWDQAWDDWSPGHFCLGLPHNDLGWLPDAPPGIWRGGSSGLRCPDLICVQLSPPQRSAGG